MEINNTSSEFEMTSTDNPSSDNGSRNVPSTSTMLEPITGRPFDRKHDNKRDVTPERELNGLSSPNRKKVKSLSEDKSKVLPSQCQQHMEMQPSTSYPTNDLSQSDFMMPQLNIHNTMNQWGKPVNSDMDMDSTITSMNPYLYMTPPDSTMFEMPLVPSFCPMPMMNRTLPSVSQKTVKVFTSCSLYPPPPSAPPPSRREKPNGCKTVFVSGIPEKVTEDIMKEVFSECGEIATIRMSKRNFCHITFTSELHVDQALFLSDYRILIENKDKPGYSGRMHVDFAVSCEDQYKCECLMRKMSRAARHANIDDPFRPLLANSSTRQSVTPVEQSRNEDDFMQSCQVLITWLERRERNKKNGRSELVKLSEEKAKLQEENELLRNQVRAATDEAVLIKEENEKKNTALLETYHTMQQNYLSTKKKLEEALKEKLALESKGSAALDYKQMVSACNENCHLAPGVIGITENETRLVTLIAIFLTAHPFGASIDYICAFLVKIDKSINTRDVEILLKKFVVFKEDSTGIGATLEKKWTYVGFKNSA